MTKEELVNQMKHHRTEYEKLSLEWKKMQQEEGEKAHLDNQLAFLAELKPKLKFYVGFDEEGKLKEIDWEEVEKLLTTSSSRAGYALTLDEHGNFGIGYDNGASSGHGSAGGFRAMVEDELEAKRYDERQARIRLMRKNAKT